MLATCGCQCPSRLSLLHSCGTGGNYGGWHLWKEKWKRSRPVVLALAKADRLSSFFSSRIGLDSQTFQSRESSQLLWVGPIPGDIAEIEAYCRIFRSAEQLHTSIMETLCNPETGVCTISYDTPSEELPILEEKVVTVLGYMLTLVTHARMEVVSGRSTSSNSTFSNSASFEANFPEGNLPPLAVFRGEMKKCCESLEVALLRYLLPYQDGNIDIWRRLQRLRNVCYDAGFSRVDGSPCPTLFANWYPVYTNPEDTEPAFWRGGQVTEDGLNWLLEKGFKTIVDLREAEEGARDGYYNSALKKAISGGKIKVVNLPVEIGTAPTVDQVHEFALIVSDVTKRPIYLHSQEGVNRTSAMVSRWKQHAARASKQNTLNSKFLKNGSKGGVGQNESVILESKNGVLFEPGKSTCEDGEMDPQNGNGPHLPDPEMTGDLKHGDGEFEEAGLVNFPMNSNPFKAQIPKCDLFSRREMRNFFKEREIYPKNYLTSKKYVNKSPAQKEMQDASPSKEETRVPGSSDEANLKSDNLLLNDDPNTGKPKSLELNINGIQVQQDNTNNKTVAVETTNFNGNSNNKSTPSRSLDLVETNMCASATGVVRLQSRKKAEMFLVRTDGFSCTREKVTESSLAFSHPSTQQQMLMWKSPPKTVLLLKKLGDELMEEAKEVSKFLYYQEKMNVLVEPDVHDIFARMPGYGFVQTFYTQDTSDLHERVDFVACLGGDGVILHASNLFRSAVPPVVSFNLGSLGFLTSHTFDDFRQDLRAVIHGNNTLDGVYITLRMRLRCEIFRNGKAIPGKVFDVLNEVVVDRGSNPYLSKIECYEHNRLITKVQGDGVIVATPTGSTAYSTAAGGSMVHPNVPCMLFTPICPHSLSFRPVILPDSSQLELKIPGDTRSNAWVSFDGKRRQQLSRGDSVRICMSQHPLPTVNKSDQTGDWFRSLIRCLNWNERLDQKAL
ncbi:putative NAD kinase 2 [Carex littledalei]|uniref:NAD(+) kinase n=1 Tax=Carex littledalei TaxID=544730 RepID=A0A833QU24_9POAL|nr:putative NAD kinase 2 [Carex littledalei]